jgi:chromate transporter
MTAGADPKTEEAAGSSATTSSPLQVFLVFLRLGLTSFGGPVAHLGYFREEFVTRRHWLDEASYADLVALCQFLPGPASSQVGISIGITRAGLAGGGAAWLGFTMPSAIALILFGYGVDTWRGLLDAGWLHGLKIVAVAVVAQAVWGMARNLTPDRGRMTLATAATLLTLAWPGSLGQILAIVGGGLIGWRFLDLGGPLAEPPPLPLRIGRGTATVALTAFFVLLIGLPLLAEAMPSHALDLFRSFYRSGSLVFGGGHVVLPLLQSAVVLPGWIGNDTFLAGYGAAQAVPGPLFTFAAYLGTVMQPGPSGWLGGLLCLVAIYIPSFLLLLGTLPFWHGLRRRRGVQAALRGVNATVVGLLLAALYQPVWTSAIGAPADFGLAVAAFVLLVFWKLPPWLVVLGTALGGAEIALI